MNIIADFHIHSHYSLATSKELTPEMLRYWGIIKGVDLIGTGDFTHPSWTKELREKITVAEPGLFKLKDELRKAVPYKIFGNKDVRFMLSAEISNIYKKHGKTRKVHNIVLAPSFEIVETIQKQLQSMHFNITSDGRPILGLDSKDLLDLLLNISKDIILIPAHIWTPWFSVLGANSGFDSIQECYEDLTEHIFAVETGLSSDPPMNWSCSFLDKYTLVSNSDAHSPEKLGRNANIFDTELSYYAVRDALKTGKPEVCKGTIDLFPQEGKYHFAGHIDCGICWSPEETNEHSGICSVCGKKITTGVMNRVAELADRHSLQTSAGKKQKDTIVERSNKLPFKNIIPLKELLSEINQKKAVSKQIEAIYSSIIDKLGSELDILLNIPIEEISKNTDERLGEAIRRMREGEVFIKQGYDGQYGVIKTFNEEVTTGNKAKNVVKIKPKHIKEKPETNKNKTDQLTIF